MFEESFNNIGSLSASLNGLIKAKDNLFADIKRDREELSHALQARTEDAEEASSRLARHRIRIDRSEEKIKGLSNQINWISDRVLKLETGDDDRAWERWNSLQ